MSIDNLRSALPSYAKDMNLNLSSLPRITSLTEQQLWGAILATAAATKVDSVVVEIAAEAKEHLSDTAYEAALGAATIMGMNNIFCPHVDITGHAKLSCRSCCSHTMLTSSCFSNHARFAHAFGQEDLPQDVIQFMRT